MLRIFAEDPAVTVVGVADINQEAPGIALARKYGIPVYSDYHDMLSHEQMACVVNVTRDNAVTRGLKKSLPPGVELIGGFSAKLMWQLIEERRQREEEMRLLVLEHEALYRVGLDLSSSQNLQEVFDTIIEYATALTNTPAGSLAVFDEATGDMSLAANRGFSEEFASQYRWKLRKGGLTGFVLNQKGPVVVNDISEHPEFNNPIMVNEKIRSLIAIALQAEGKIVGLLYVDDFEPRQFTNREVAVLSLLSTYAAIAIDRVRLLEETKKRAITDGLTRLYNHRHFMQRLGEEIARSRRYARPLSLLMIDIDHFKSYNDTWGHLEGNKLLRKLSKVLTNQSREVDIVARYGGEEFAVIVPEADKADSCRLAERIRSKIETTVFPNQSKGSLGNTTVSAGVAAFPADATSPLALIERADAALYKAKATGRNKVCVADPRQTPSRKTKQKSRIGR